RRDRHDPGTADAEPGAEGNRPRYRGLSPRPSSGDDRHRRHHPGQHMTHRHQNLRYQVLFAARKRQATPPSAASSSAPPIRLCPAAGLTLSAVIACVVDNSKTCPSLASGGATTVSAASVAAGSMT